MKIVKEATKKQIEIHVLKGSMPETDKYGHKKMLEELNKLARCPNDGVFLVYKDESRETLECPKCNFEKPTPQEFGRGKTQ